MSTQIQFRRGTTAQLAGFTGALGELTVDTTKNVVVTHDGATAGGHPMQPNSGSTSLTGGVVALNASAALTAAQLGSLVQYSGSTAAQVISLPAIAGVLNGLGYALQNISTVPVQISAGATSVALLGTAFYLQPGESCFIESQNALSWNVIGYIQAFGVPAATAPAQAAQAGALSGIANLTATVAGNALTVNLANIALAFKNATLNGAPIYMASGALSLTVPNTATLGSVSAQSTRYAVMVAYNAGTPVLCIANLGGGLNLDETGVISPTTISTGATSASAIYSASAVGASSPYRLVGYLDATEATAGTWATAPSNVQGIGGQGCVALSGLGIGQSWQTVTRTTGTTYYNTTGKPITLAWLAQSIAAGALAIATVNGNSATYSSQSYQATGYLYLVTTIPPNASYVMTFVSGAISPGSEQARELR